MLSVEELEAGRVMVCAIGNCSFQVATVVPFLNDWPGRPICTSYCVPGCSMTIEPRHSELRLSNHISMASRHVLSPCLRNCILQPAEPAPGLVQYIPIDWKVATPRTLLLSLGIVPPDELVPFCTLTEICEVVLRPSASNACALSVCVPLAR